MRWFKCSLCEINKDETHFYKDKSKKTGYRPRCKDCERISRNIENRRAYEKEYRLKNPEKRSAIVLKSMNKNLEHHRKVLSEYRKTEAFNIRKRSHYETRRARMKEAFVEKVDLNDFFEASDKKCFYCGIELTFKTTEFDHYIPIAKGGKHETSNIRCSCVTCNRRKGAKMPRGVGYQMV